MTTDIAKLLVSLGLTASETKVYLSSLELGPTSVQHIARHARLSRTATYEAISGLQVRGFMSSYTREKKKFIAAEDPENALALFKTEVKHMEDHLELLGRALPELKLKLGGDRPVVKFFEGREAVYSIFRDVVTAHPKEICEVANYNDVAAHLDIKLLQDARRDIQMDKLLDRVKFRMLHRGDHPAQKNPKGEYCELLPELGEFHGDIWIYADRVVFVTFIEKIMAVRIEQQAFADTARVLFEAAWRICYRPKSD